jgi:phenylacetate-CoA ligase
MTLHAEAPEGDGALAAKIAAALQEATKLKGDVTLAPMGSLPNDGKLIADERSYS